MLISNEFTASDACQRMFRFAKESLQKDIQLCMVGEGREWMKSDFIGFQVTEQVIIYKKVSNSIRCPLQRNQY